MYEAAFFSLSQLTINKKFLYYAKRAQPLKGQPTGPLTLRTPLIALLSTGSPLGPVFANIIKTELESTVVKELFIVRLYVRNVDDTFLVVKEKYINFPCLIPWTLKTA